MWLHARGIMDGWIVFWCGWRVRARVPVQPGAYRDLEEEFPGVRASTKLTEGGLEALRNMTRREDLCGDADPAARRGDGVLTVTWTHDGPVACGVPSPRMEHVVVHLL